MIDKNWEEMYQRVASFWSDMICFSATKEQLAQVIANAVNSSSPVGLGHMAHKNVKYEPADFYDYFIKADGSLADAYVDYHNGAMVKFEAFLCFEYWICHYKAFPAYQGWCDTYPTYKDLLLSVDGVEIIKEKL